MPRTSPADRSEMEHMSSPDMRAAAAKMSASFSTAIVSSWRSIILVTTCVSSCGLGCGWGCRAGCMFRENFIQRANGCIDVFALEDVRRQEAQNGVAGAVDEDAALEHFGDDELAEIGRIELRC